MPKVRRSRKPPPEGWELIEPTLDELDQKMREGNMIKIHSRLSDNIRFTYVNHVSFSYMTHDLTQA